MTLPQESSTVPVHKKLIEPLMTSENRQILGAESGANVDWAPDDGNVIIAGSAEQVKRAKRLLARVLMHTRWGISDSKITRLLKPRAVESVLCRLSPMDTLRPVSKVLSGSHPMICIGSAKTNHVVVADALVSRQHCVLELDPDKGAVYILNCSTNGTFLNGVRLPSKESGKVILSHGDELLLKDPQNGEQEFGYIVNIEELHVKEEVKLQALEPNRYLGFIR